MFSWVARHALQQDEGAQINLLHRAKDKATDLFAGSGLSSHGFVGSQPLSQQKTRRTEVAGTFFNYAAITLQTNPKFWPRLNALSLREGFYVLRGPTGGRTCALDALPV